MIVAVYILTALIVTGMCLYIHEQRYRNRHADTPEDSIESDSENPAETSPGIAAETPEVCCGLHVVCEKLSLANNHLYYEDEYLDRYSGRSAESFASTEIEEFREVLLTLLPSDLPGWRHSLENRGIVLPLELHDEYLMMLSEINEPV